MAAGALVLIGFGLWERLLGRRPDGQPLVDLALFGVLFTAPQYFQAILGTKLAVGLAVGATTGLTSGTGFLSLWTPLVGLGMALAPATASPTRPATASSPASRSPTGSDRRHCSTRCRPPSSMAPLP